MSKQKKFLLSVIVSTIIMLPVIAYAIPWLPSVNYTAKATVDTDLISPITFLDSGPNRTVTASVASGAVCAASATADGLSMTSMLYAWSLPTSGSWGSANTITTFDGYFTASEDSWFEFTYDFDMSSYPLLFTHSMVIRDLTDIVTIFDDPLVASGILLPSFTIIKDHNIQVEISLIGKLFVEEGNKKTYSAEFNYDMDISPKTAPPTAVPEPTTILLLGAGLTGLAGFRKKFRNN